MEQYKGDNNGKPIVLNPEECEVLSNPVDNNYFLEYSRIARRVGARDLKCLYATSEKVILELTMITLD